MTALLYLLVGVLAVALGIRGWLPNQRDAAHSGFLGLGISLGIAYTAFALSLLPGLAEFRLLYMASGLWVPAFALWTVDRVFGMDSKRVVGLLFLTTALVMPLTVVSHFWLFMDVPRASPSEVVGGLFSFGAFGLVLWRLWQVHGAAELGVERVRLRYLLGVSIGAVVFTLLEQLARILSAPVDPIGLPVTSRGVILQGAIPPFSVLLGAISLYFLYQALVLTRLLDLNEMFSRMTALVLSAALLVTVDGVTVVWVGTFTDYPIHGTFQLFLGSVLFLAGYDVVRDSIGYAANRAFNRRGQQLQEALDALRVELPRAVSTKTLTETLLGRLHASGRVPVSSLYLWDRGLDAFASIGDVGEPVTPPLGAVAASPFIEGFDAGDRYYLRAAYRHATDADMAELLDAMNADVVLPLRSGSGVVLGWLCLRAQAWSDGFSSEEIHRLEAIMSATSTVVTNIRDFQVLEEKQRLASLGAMAAGLAHEIRNPLAGIKGAAQFLQGEEMAGASSDMLSIVVEETDRLDVVVRQFLDYARPSNLTLTHDHVNALASHVCALVRAEGLPKGITLVEELAGDLPPLPMDRDRITQVVLNLMRNGLQAMPEGGTLTLRTKRRGDTAVEIAIIDTGEGIPADARLQLFVPFFTTKRAGAALGLAICDRLVRAHGGTIDVISAPGHGSTFTIRLPFPQVEERDPPTAEAAIA